MHVFINALCAWTLFADSLLRCDVRPEKFSSVSLEDDRGAAAPPSDDSLDGDARARARFDTLSLLKLRLALDRAMEASEKEKHEIAASFGDSDTFMELLRLRLRYRDELKDYNAAEGVANALEIFRAVWKSLRNVAGHGSLLRVPPIYEESKEVESILTTLVLSVRMREKSEILEEFPTGHMVIGGIQGTGKTTLLKAISLAVAVCSPNFFFLYLDLSIPSTAAQRQLTSLFSELMWRWYNDDTSGAWGSKPLQLSEDQDAGIAYDDFLRALQERESRPLQVGVIVDEVQKLHVPPTDPDREVNRLFLTQIHYYARTSPQAFLVMSGSSTRLRHYLVPSTSRSSKDFQAMCAGLPDFNHDLCHFYSVPALRSVSELKAYLGQRYPDLPETLQEDARVQQLLSETGGIGRLVHVCVSKATANQTEWVFPLDNKRDREMDVLLAPHSLFRALTDAMRVEAADPKQCEECIADISHGREIAVHPKDIEAEWEAVVNGMCSQGFQKREITDGIYEWVERGFLYGCWNPASFNRILALQLARPADAKLIFEAVPTKDDLAAARSFATSLEYPGKLNAGMFFETLICPRLRHCTPWGPNWHFSDTSTTASQYLHIADGVLWVVNEVGATRERSRATVELLHGKTFLWKREKGLDCVHFEYDNKTRTLYISGWQCKSGALHGVVGGGDFKVHRKKLSVVKGERSAGEGDAADGQASGSPAAAGGGGSASSAADDANEEDEPPLGSPGNQITGLSDLPADKNVVAIAVKAEAGFLELMSVLQGQLADDAGGIDVTVSRLLICTTKRVAANAKKITETPVELDARLLNEMGIRSRRHGGGRHKYDACVRGGLSWVKECLSHGTDVLLQQYVTRYERSVTSAAP